MTGDHDRLPPRYTVIPRRCGCSRGRGEGPIRIAAATLVGVHEGWTAQPHCEGVCRIQAFVWQFKDGDAWWSLHFGYLTVREADDFTLMRPDGPTAEDWQKANGA
jgi:hypothetical protein